MLRKTLPAIFKIIKDPNVHIIEIYGEAASGKTTLAIQIATDYIWNDKNVIYICTEIPLPLERFQQISGKNATSYKNLELISINSFNQQIKIIDNLYELSLKMPDLLIFDTISRLYRLELEEEKKNYLLNRELNRQIALLKYYATRYDFKIILTNQVHANIRSKTDTEPVAKTVVDFWADIIIKTKKTGHLGKRKMMIINPEIDETKEFLLDLYHRGFQEVKEDFS